MIDQIRRLLQPNRKQIIRESVIHWLSDSQWRTEGMIHDFVMTCLRPNAMEKISPWVTQEEVDTILRELEQEGLAQSKEAPLIEGLEPIVTYWRKL